MAIESNVDPPPGVLRIAEDALDRGDCEAAVTAATALVEAGEPWLLDGLLLRATALERWADGPPDRLFIAASDWRRLVELAPSSVTFHRLARVLLKLGDHQAALDYLMSAERMDATPEVLLGFAECYRTASPPDLERAKDYYLRAALKGRTQGMRGYGEVAMELDQPLTALAMVLFAFAATPFLAVTMGIRRHAGF